MLTVPDHAAPEASRIGEIGFVTSINGSKVTLDVSAQPNLTKARVTVGSFVGICAGESYLVGIVTMLTATGSAGAEIRARADLDLLGEIRADKWGAESFQRGVACYPSIGDRASLLSGYNLRLVFQATSSDVVEIGSLSLDPSMPACVKVDDLISRHFAVLGTTGVGKSSGVAVILDQILKARSDVRVFLLDVHNEYATCFGSRASVVSPRNLKLPFWLFNLEETVDIIYGGRPGIDEEIEILAELIPLAKSKYAQYKDSGERGLAKRVSARTSSYTVDTPVPYVLQDLIGLIDERMGRLENRSARMHYHRLIGRIDAIRNDPRYAFMFENANVGGDMMGEILAHLFRLDPGGAPMTVMQLAGLPVETVDAVVCVLSRLAYEFGIWSDGASPLLFVCEEAHRFASADHAVGFSPTRRALSRIAKEGRKYGVFLGLVTQRPAELDATIVSQCSTLFAMRMANERDQAILSAAVSDAANLLAFVPSLGTGEVIAFGEGVPLPTRMKFRQLPREGLPRAESLRGRDDGADERSPAAFVGSVVERWRNATMNGKLQTETEQAPESETRRLLRRPLESLQMQEPAPAPAHAPLAREAQADAAVWQLR